VAIFLLHGCGCVRINRFCLRQHGSAYFIGALVLRSTSAKPKLKRRSVALDLFGDNKLFLRILIYVLIVADPRAAVGAEHMFSLLILMP
jgi:hypothetical protein